MSGNAMPSIDRYMEVVNRISALLIGTIAVEMIFEGLGSRLHATLTATR